LSFGRPKTCASSSRTEKTPCVEATTWSSSPFHSGERGVRLHAGVRLDLGPDGQLEDAVGLGEELREVLLASPPRGAAADVPGLPDGAAAARRVAGGPPLLDGLLEDERRPLPHRLLEGDDVGQGLVRDGDGAEGVVGRPERGGRESEDRVAVIADDLLLGNLEDDAGHRRSFEVSRETDPGVGVAASGGSARRGDPGRPTSCV